MGETCRDFGGSDGGGRTEAGGYLIKTYYYLTLPLVVGTPTVYWDNRLARPSVPPSESLPKSNLRPALVP